MNSFTIHIALDLLLIFSATYSAWHKQWPAVIFNVLILWWRHQAC